MSARAVDLLGKDMARNRCALSACKRGFARSDIAFANFDH